MSVTVRPAMPGDEAEVLRLVERLAVHEHKPDAVQVTLEELRAAMFGGGDVHAFLAELEGRSVGLALWFCNFSTWTGAEGMYLEDMFVEDGARGQGVGRALFRALAREAGRRGCRRIDWAVLDGNDAAMAFYAHIGGRRMQGWQPWRLDEAGIARLAGE